MTLTSLTMSSSINLVGDIPINIPFPFPTLRRHIPGLMRGTYYGVTAASGAGKTQLTKFLAVTTGIAHAKKINLDYKVLYFALEESEEEFYDSVRIHELIKRYNINKDPDGKEINQYYLKGEYGPIHPEVKEKLTELEPIIDDIKNYVTVIDSVNNPTGIYKYIKNFSNSRGTHYYQHIKTKEIIAENALPHSDENVYIYHKYIPDNPNEMVCVVVDHINLLGGEKDYKDLFSAMGLLSTQYLLAKVVKRLNYCVISVHQQAMSGEGIEHAKLNMLYPSKEKLGDNKLIGRDYPIILGLFAPYPHKDMLRTYPYDLEFFQDNMRSLHVIKHRKGKGGFEVALFFDGRGQKFSELPSAKDTKAMNLVKEKIEEARKSGRL